MKGSTVNGQANEFSADCGVWTHSQPRVHKHTSKSTIQEAFSVLLGWISNCCLPQFFDLETKASIRKGRQSTSYSSCSPSLNVYHSTFGWIVFSLWNAATCSRQLLLSAIWLLAGSVLAFFFFLFYWKQLPAAAGKVTRAEWEQTKTGNCGLWDQNMELKDGKMLHIADPGLSVQAASFTARILFVLFFRYKTINWCSFNLSGTLPWDLTCSWGSKNRNHTKINPRDVKMLKKSSKSDLKHHEINTF